MIDLTEQASYLRWYTVVFLCNIVGIMSYMKTLSIQAIRNVYNATGCTTGCTILVSPPLP